jgi:pimeloyl-ACP methyl ester carboxylesterase
MLDDVVRRRITLPDSGLEIALLDWGGDGPLALLHHANGFCAGVWGLVAERLRKQFRVVAMDARGHGDSAKPDAPGSYLWSEFSRDVLGVADVLTGGREPIALGLGHSFGGTAITLAAIERPRLFERIVLLDPIVFPSLSEWRAQIRSAGSNAMAEGARRRRHEWASRDEAREKWMGKEMFSDWDPRALELYLAEGLRERDDGGVELKCPGEIEAAVFEGAGSVDVMALAHRLSTPALILWARRGNFPREHFENLAGRMQDATVQEADTGHFVPMEDPELVAERVLAFSARSGSRGASSRPSPRPSKPRG